MPLAKKARVFVAGSILTFGGALGLLTAEASQASASTPSGGGWACTSNGYYNASTGQTADMNGHINAPPVQPQASASPPGARAADAAYKARVQAFLGMQDPNPSTDDASGVPPVEAP